MNKELESFFNGMSEQSKNRFMSFSKGFNLFAVEPNLCKTEEALTIVFVNSEESVVYNDDDSIYNIKCNRNEYVMISTATTAPLGRGVYKINELPSFSIENFQKDLIATKTLKFSDLDSLSPIKTRNQFYDLFSAVSEHLSFSDLNEVAYKDDENLKIETIFEIQGAHDGKGSGSVKRICFNNHIVMYANYQGKYGDEATGIVVNKSLYKEMLKYVEHKYNGEEIESESPDSLIYGKFGTDFYDFVDKR